MFGGYIIMYYIYTNYERFNKRIKRTRTIF